ncbi:SpaA isopeptide-forming pilin-related protein [Bifidobacterium pseudolongum]|uniref:SpaA isopeptide-forming pilin-related protein n=1 Tax=Bifidobacterium pseudolongum TaxID=1694 RepID=UPI0005297CEC|nr:SpaA isopeptide-forming pilin-related protein [Bifidobacterium pseudolongum]UNP91200.1 isopeptide-forming domain-containing fimbrial protein [Bifidobacterium pseudolongum subsp. pseudolongum]WCA41089.1 SpaA isopeptide-forming pilin-related protein [Bifidobacterium pseudolongum subsp. pseudolongum]
MNLKRVFAGVAAAATMLGGLALGAATATAADATANTITINGDVNGREFTAYLLGEYTNPVVSNSAVTSVDFNQSTAWKNPSIAAAAQTAAAVAPATTIPDQYKGNELAWIASLSQTGDAARLRAFADALRAATSKPAPSTTVTGADGTAVISGLTPGYYLVTDGDGAPILVGTNIIADGTVYTTLNGATLATAFAKPTQPTKPGKEVDGDTQGTVSLGDVLTYTITGVIPGNPSGTELKMKFKDVASKGLTLPSTTDGFEVRIGGAVYNAYTLTQTIDANTKETTTEFDLGDVKAFAGQTVTITYNATVNEDAVDKVNNTAYVYDPYTGQYVEEGTPVENKLYSFDFTKQDADGNALAGAEFTISGDNIDEDYTANGGVTTVTSGTDGKVTFKGLAAGEYTVQETKVPNGFLQNVKPEFTVTIDAEGNVTFGTDVWGLMKDGVVKNVKSVTQLPLTGAAGITMLIVVALLLGGAAALIGVRSHSLKRQLTA